MTEFAHERRMPSKTANPAPWRVMRNLPSASGGSTIVTRDGPREQEDPVNPVRAFVAGVIGAIAMSLLMIWLRAIGIPLHLELRLASMLGMQVWAVGFVAYLIIGGITGLIYALAFEYILNEAGIGPGLMVGACHSIFAGFIWAQLSGPGRFWDNFGPGGIAALFLLHFVYGAIVGALYRTQHHLAWA